MSPGIDCQASSFFSYIVSSPAIVCYTEGLNAGVSPDEGIRRNCSCDKEAYDGSHSDSITLVEDSVDFFGSFFLDRGTLYVESVQAGRARGEVAVTRNAPFSPRLMFLTLRTTTVMGRGKSLSPNDAFDGALRALVPCILIYIQVYE